MKVLVTGGSGFLGLAILKALKQRGDTPVSLSRGHSRAVAALGIEQVQGDVASLDIMLAASKGCDAVIHTAAKAGIHGRLGDYTQTNVGGTIATIGACEMNGVGRLVYTSTPSVVHRGVDIENGDESLPYPARFNAHYPATKAAAERKVLAANGARLATVALRPHLIFGPGDNHLLPRLVARAQRGKLRLVGAPKKVDVTYIDNAAEAHLNALDRLQPGSACAGRAYFISQGEPITLEDMVNRLLRACGEGPVKQRLSPLAARLAGSVLEKTWTLLGRDDEPLMTRFLAEQLSTAHWFNISAARRDLGYTPKVSLIEGLVRIQDWWAREGRARSR